jgi:hypothetical protein
VEAELDSSTKWRFETEDQSSRSRNTKQHGRRCEGEKFNGERGQEQEQHKEGIRKSWIIMANIDKICRWRFGEILTHFFGVVDDEPDSRLFCRRLRRKLKTGEEQRNA